MNRIVFASVCASILAACTPAGAPSSPAPESPSASQQAAPQPPQGLADAFPDCTWGEVSAGGVSIWSFTCPQQRLVGDETLPGFVREADGQRFPVIWLFAKAPEAPIDAALPAIRAASPGGEACVLEPISGQAGRYQLMPTGDVRRAYAAFLNGESDGPSLPCGRLGPSEAGAVFIQAVDGAPDKVAAIVTPSDIPIFDWNTLRAAD